MDCTGCKRPPHTGYRGSPPRRDCRGSPPRMDYKGCTLLPHTGCRGSPRMDYKGCTLLPRRDCTGSPLRRGCTGCKPPSRTDCTDSLPHRDWPRQAAQAAGRRSSTRRRPLPHRGCMDYKGCRPLLRTGCRDLPPHTGCRGSPPRMDYKGCTLLPHTGCRGSPPRRDCRDYKLQGPASLRMDCMGYRPLLRTGYSRRRDCTDCTPPPHRGCTGSSPHRDYRD